MKRGRYQKEEIALFIPDASELLFPLGFTKTDVSLVERSSWLVIIFSRYRKGKCDIDEFVEVVDDWLSATKKRMRSRKGLL